MALFSFSDVFALFGAAWLAARMGLAGFVTAIILMATMQQTVYAGTVNPIRALGWKEHDFGLEPAAKPLDCIASGARDPVARALLVGAHLYPKVKGMALEGPPNDVALMANALQARGVRDANIERLVGGSATRQAFTDQLSAAIARTQCDDSLTIYLSTHGTGAFHGYNTLRRRDLNEPSAYFLLEDITPEAFSSAPPWGMISGTELESAVKALRARGAHIFVITDFIGGQAMQLDGASGWHCCKDGERLHGSQGSIAVFAPGYAAEMTLPKNGPDRKRYGVFTFYLGVGLANPN